MDTRRKYAWLVLAGYLSLAAAVPMLTPAVPETDPLPPSTPLLLADNSDTDTMMLPLRQQANAALHANMFLVRRAGEVMEHDVAVLPQEMRLETFLRKSGHDGRMKHIVVSDGDRIVGVLRVNTALRRGLEDAEESFTLGEIAQRNYTVAREEDIVFDVVTRMARRRANMAVVVRGAGRPRAGQVVGIISKEHIADSVAESIRPYGA